MSAHAIGSATISFGLVSVPVQLYSSGEPSATISFNWLHKKCGTRLKQQYYCPKDEEVVERDDMLKGYEFAKGRYVTFTPDEVKALGDVYLYTVDDLAPATYATMLADVCSFLARCWIEGPDIGALNPTQLGHDLWLTRNRHGAGFWDRGLGELGDQLTATAHQMGEQALYVVDGQLGIE